MDSGESKSLLLEMRPGLLGKIKVSLKRLGLLKSVALYLLLKHEERTFVKSVGSKEEERRRRAILSRLKTIYQNILCLHFPSHYIYVSQFILDLKVDGPIIECGTFTGGSTAELSVIAKETHRKLYACDSFQGLPQPASAQDGAMAVFNDSRSHTFRAGDYAATLDEVKRNVTENGEIDVCEFIPGFFNQTLPGLNIEPAVIVLDVDLVSSARDCLKFLWPRLKRGGYVFTHEAEYETYMKGIMDKTWWREELGECPPLIFGAGSSLSPTAEGLAVFRKE